jgi:preprotein translocase subunit SecA
MRKTVLKFDDVMNAQREIMYAERNRIIDGQDVHSFIMNMFPAVIDKAINKCVDDEVPYFDWDFEKINRELENGLIEKGKNLISEAFCESYSESFDADDLREVVLKEVEKRYNDRMMEAGKIGVEFENVEKVILLRVVDVNWMNHIDDMQTMKNEIFARGFGGQDPIIAYKKEAYDMFDEMTEKIRETACMILLNTTIEIRRPQPVRPVKMTEATVSDPNPKKQQTN